MIKKCANHTPLTVLLNGSVTGKLVVNSLMHSVPEWSDILSKSCSICCKIFNVCLIIFGTLCIKGLIMKGSKAFVRSSFRNVHRKTLVPESLF